MNNESIEKLLERLLTQSDKQVVEIIKSDIKKIITVLRDSNKLELTKDNRNYTIITTLGSVIGSIAKQAPDLPAQTDFIKEIYESALRTLHFGVLWGEV